MIVTTILVAGLVFMLYGPPRNAPEKPPALLQWVDFGAFPPLSGQALRFPRDHGGHPEAPLESWQIQGSLTTQSGHRTGFQFHLFSLGLRPGRPERRSAWATYRYFLAYFTRTDPDTRTFQVWRRIERNALGLSGAVRGRIWCDDWQLAFSPDHLTLRAGRRNAYLQLTLTPSRPPVGINGATLRRYHLNRINARGRWGTEPVTGSVWFEHAWGTLPLPSGEVGLQRFQIQLRDGRDLVCLKLQRRGSASPGPARCLLEDAPHRKTLTEVRLTPTAHWRSPDGIVFPTAWRLDSPPLRLAIRAVIPGQRIDGLLSLWSGWISVLDEAGEAGEGFAQILGPPSNGDET